jgi:hypothetical protein
MVLGFLFKEKAMRKVTPLRAIRAKCLDCSLSKKEIRFCAVSSCPLYPYRLGKNPARKGMRVNHPVGIVEKLSEEAFSRKKELSNDQI